MGGGVYSKTYSGTSAMPKETELIKSKLELIDFLRSYLTLVPAGKNFKALCPFHQEKTPSFIASPDRQVWHCFGCGEGGDLITFAMKYENLEFPEALRFLAEKAGIPIQTLSPTQQREFGILYDIHIRATEFFRDALVKSKVGGDYLANRKLVKETIDEFSLGFAPGGETLTLHLLHAGFSIGDIARAGLAHKNMRGLYRDRFENRVMFPIHNSVDKVVAFTGRFIGVPQDTIPKYLNSPDTPIFDKSKILYGFQRSKHAIQETREAFLVEGQMDFLMAWQSGVRNAIAVSGTALTAQHLERLRRLADAIVVSFDNDEAGFRALERSLDLFGGFDFHVKAIELGTYKDPAEACEKDPKFLATAIAKAEPAMSRVIRHAFADPSLTRDLAAKKRAVRRILERIVRVQSPVEREVWIRETSHEAGVGEPALMDEISTIAQSQKPRGGTQGSPSAQEGSAAQAFPRGRTALIAERLIALAFAKKEFSDILERNKELLPEPYRAVLRAPEGSERTEMLTMRASYEFSGTSEDTLMKEFNELLHELTLETLKLKREELKLAIRAAEREGDDAGLTKAMEEFNGVSTQIKELTA